MSAIFFFNLKKSDLKFFKLQSATYIKKYKYIIFNKLRIYVSRNSLNYGVQQNATELENVNDREKIIFNKQAIILL